MKGRYVNWTVDSLLRSKWPPTQNLVAAHIYNNCNCEFHLHGIMDYSKQLRYASLCEFVGEPEAFLQKIFHLEVKLTLSTCWNRYSINDASKSDPTSKTKWNWCAVAISISEPLKFTDWSSTIGLYKKFPSHFAFKMRKMHILTTNIWYF